MAESQPDRPVPKGTKVFALVSRSVGCEEGFPGEVIEVREGVAVHAVKFENGDYKWLLAEELTQTKPEKKAGATSARVLAAVASVSPKLVRTEP